MPQMGGIELKMLVQNLKADVKFLMMSGYSDKLDRNESFLEKPFTAIKLLKKIREILDA